jgi:hypothetical protein
MHFNKRATARCEFMSLQRQGSLRAADPKDIQLLHGMSSMTPWYGAAALSSVEALLRCSHLCIVNITEKETVSGMSLSELSRVSTQPKKRLLRKGGGPRELRGLGTGTRGYRKVLA